MKQKWKFNVVDVIAAALILAVLVFVGYKLASRGGGETVDQEVVKVTYQVKKEGVPAELYESSKQHIPSRMMASGALVGGEIVAVEETPYYVLGPDGQWVRDEAHTTLIFTAETEVPREAVMTTKVGEQEIRVGKTHILKSEYIEFEDTVIIDVRWDGLD